MYDLEKNIRCMIVEIIKRQNKELLLNICRKFNLNEEEIMQKYLIPYYYMPIIEREIKNLTID